MGSSRQEYWSGLPFPSPGDLPHPETEAVSPALAGGFFTLKLRAPNHKAGGSFSPLLWLRASPYSFRLSLMTEEVLVQEDGDLGHLPALGRQAWSGPPVSLAAFARGPAGRSCTVSARPAPMRFSVSVTHEEGWGPLLLVVWGVAPSTPQVIPVMTELTCNCTDGL